jgi:hypothetical protein
VAMFMILCANSFSVSVVCYLALCSVVSGVTTAKMGEGWAAGA